LARDHEFNVRWLRAARRVLKPDGTLWVSGTHHIIFGSGFALQRLGFRIINNLIWQKSDAGPNALHTASVHQGLWCRYCWRARRLLKGRGLRSIRQVSRTMFGGGS
jgi:DNA modification methylase